MITFNLPFIVDELARQEVVVGAFLLAAGLLFMLMGLRLSRVLVALSYGVIGFILGCSVPAPDEARIAAGMITALGLAGASVWVIRPAVAVLAGLWAGLVTFLLVSRLAAVDDQIALVAGAVVFAGAASITYVMLQEIIAIITSLEGTLLFLGGLIILMNQSPVFWSHMRNLLVSSTIFGPFLVLSGTVVGYYTQVAEQQKKSAGRSG
jgi:hypothetical protein